MNDKVDQPVEPPCFVDERTVLMAHRVVPVQHVRTKLKHKRICYLVGAFVLAILLGAASGLVSAYFELREMSASQVMRQNLSTSTVVVEDLGPSVSQESFNVENIPGVSTKIPPLQQQPSAKRSRSRKPESFTLDATYSKVPQQLGEDEELRTIREEVMLTGSRQAMPLKPRGQHRPQRSERDLLN
jgi:hypothetical protein